MKGCLSLIGVLLMCASVLPLSCAGMLVVSVVQKDTPLNQPMALIWSVVGVVGMGTGFGLVWIGRKRS
jgi:uncharacterized membrane-anchored protein YitT (DUF2179 family)